MQLYRPLSNFELLWEMSSSETQKKTEYFSLFKRECNFTQANNKEVITCWYELLQSTIVKIDKKH